MQIRLTGTRQECTDFAAVLPDLIAHCAQVRQVSGFYPNRAPSLLGRLYLDIAPLGQCPAGRVGVAGPAPHGGM